MWESSTLSGGACHSRLLLLCRGILGTGQDSAHQRNGDHSLHWYVLRQSTGDQHIAKPCQISSCLSTSDFAGQEGVSASF